MLGSSPFWSFMNDHAINSNWNVFMQLYDSKQLLTIILYPKTAVIPCNFRAVFTVFYTINNYCCCCEEDTGSLWEFTYNLRIESFAALFSCSDYVGVKCPIYIWCSGNDYWWGTKTANSWHVMGGQTARL